MRYAFPLAAASVAFQFTSAFAATISVEDFGDMTRVTIPLSAEIEWTIDHNPQAVSYEVASHDLNLSSPPVEGDGRLTKLNVWTENFASGVDIAYGCECTSSSYRTGDNELVIDIVERPPPVLEVVELPMVEEIPTATTVIDAIPVDTPVMEAVPVDTAVLDTTPIVTTVRETAVVRSAVVPATTLTRKRNNPKPTQIVLRPERVKPDETLRLARVLYGTPLPRNRPIRAAQSVDLDSAVLGIRKAVEAQMNDAASEGRITLTGAFEDNRIKTHAGCPDEAALDLRRLTDSSDFRKPLPGLRAAVLDDMKQVNPSAVRSLARHFIAFGLGTEAAAVIQSFETGGEPEKTIGDMAHFLDGHYEELEQSPLFQETCGRNAAVWRAALASIKQSGTVAAAYSATDGAVFDLPDPLRKKLGAMIALGLIDEGERETAMRIWRSLEHATGPETSEVRLLGAYVSSEETAPQAAVSPLLRLAESQQPEAVPAALRVSSILIEEFNREAAQRVLMAIDELAFVYRGSDTEAALVIAQSKLNARYGDLAAALTELDERRLAEPEREAYWRRVVQETIRSAMVGADPLTRPSDFAAILKAQERLDQSPESDRARLSLARQLVEAGAAHLVEEVLPLPVLARSEDARGMMARASLLMGRSDQAITLLKGVQSEESLDLRRRAMALGAKDYRKDAQGRFNAMPTEIAGAPLSYARQLLDQSKTDLTLVEEMLEDG